LCCIRNTEKIQNLATICQSLQRIFRDLRQTGTHYKEMQDVEFTIEQGKLWMLQTRTASAQLRLQ